METGRRMMCSTKSLTKARRCTMLKAVQTGCRQSSTRLWWVSFGKIVCICLIFIIQKSCMYLGDRRDSRPSFEQLQHSLEQELARMIWLLWWFRHFVLLWYYMPHLIVHCCAYFPLSNPIIDCCYYCFAVWSCVYLILWYNDKIVCKQRLCIWLCPIHI